MNNTYSTINYYAPLFQKYLWTILTVQWIIMPPILKVFLNNTYSTMNYYAPLFQKYLWTILTVQWIVMPLFQKYLWTILTVQWIIMPPISKVFMNNTYSTMNWLLWSRSKEIAAASRGITKYGSLCLVTSASLLNSSRRHWASSRLHQTFRRRISLPNAGIKKKFTFNKIMFTKGKKVSWW